jgi:hypothetical protein
MPTGAPVEIVGLKELEQALRATDAQWSKELAKALRKVAVEEAGEARKFAAGEGGQAAHFAGKITGRATSTTALIGVARVANAAFWGAKPGSRSGWNDGWRNGTHTDRAYIGGTPQFRPWVGNSWDPGGASGGPYAINAALYHDLAHLERRFAEVIDEVYKRAFPQR